MEFRGIPVKQLNWHVTFLGLYSRSRLCCSVCGVGTEFPTMIGIPDPLREIPSRRDSVLRSQWLLTDGVPKSSSFQVNRFRDS